MGSIVECKRPGKSGGKEKVVYRAMIRRQVNGKAVGASRVCATKTEAKDWIRNNETDLVLRQAGASKGRVFRDSVELFVAAPPDKGTRYWAPSHLEFWVEQFGGRAICEITHADINTGKVLLRTRKVMRATPDGVKATKESITSATINRYLASLSSVFNFAKSMGYIDIHPMKAGGVSKLEESKGRTRILTDDETVRLMDAAASSTWDLMPFFLRMCLTTAARKSEILNLRWRNVDFDNSVAIVNKTKNDEARALPLVNDVKVRLTELYKVRANGCDYIFFDPRHPERPKNINMIWKYVRQRAGLWKDREDKLDQVVLHSTRHTAATKMVRSGASTVQVARVTGHKTLSMLGRYSHLSAADSVDLAQRILAGEPVK